MKKTSVLGVIANSVKEEIRQHALLDIFTAAYFGVKPNELEFKYPDSSLTMQVKLLALLVGDRTLICNWLSDDFDKKTGIQHTEKTRCGEEVEMSIRTAEDIADCIFLRNGRMRDNCDLCRGVCQERGIQCK